MKIKKILRIAEYKSFKDFSWQKFFNNTTFHERVNLFYGENGSGKSSICNILKSASNTKEFSKYKPQDAIFECDDVIITFKNENWINSVLNKENISFFDKEFIDKNVHMGSRGRGTHQGEQEQESGKMIIEFDSKAIRLRELRDEGKKTRDKIDEELNSFFFENRELLNFSLSNDEKIIFKKYYQKTTNELIIIKRDLEKYKCELEEILKKDHETQANVIEIQDISFLDEVESLGPISDLKQFELLFNYPTTTNNKIELEQKTIEKIVENKDFYEKGISLFNNNPDVCPFCQATDRKKEITTMMNMFEQIYNDIYKEKMDEFLHLKDVLMGELLSTITFLENINLNDIFIQLKRIEQKFKIRDIYLVEEEERFTKPEHKKITRLLNEIKNLEEPNKKEIKSLYDGTEKDIKNVKTFISLLNTYISGKNEIIKYFKFENTDEKLKTRIQDNKDLVHKLEFELLFLNSGNLEKQKNKEKVESDYQLLLQQSETEKENYKTFKEKYENYCSQGAFLRVIGEIEKYFEKFSFNFSLKLDKTRGGQSKEFPFSFKVLDLDGNERDFIEGLSEGELQVLSLCFFFAFQEIQNKKEERILIFDDPITSLDNSNLSLLVDLIASESEKYSQFFIFTHHRTFFKFLRNRFINYNEYNVLRNRNGFGGSFLCVSGKRKFLQKLKDFDQYLLHSAENSGILDIELITVEYGQYLRYEIERFIKNDLLFWHAEGNFTKAIEGIKRNKQIDDNDLDKIRSIYSFCNWTTSHVDVGEENGLEQLKNRINEFVIIYEKNLPEI